MRRAASSSRSRSAGCAADGRRARRLRSGSRPRPRCSPGVLVGGTVAKDRSVAQDVERLPPPTRAPCARPGSACPPGPEESWRALDAARPRALAPLPAGRPTADRARPREHGRRRLRRARRGRRPRVRTCCSAPAGCRARVRPERCEVLRLRGRGPPAGRPGAARRRGRDGDASLEPALRRLPRADRQRARRRRARARPRRSRPATTARRPARSSSRRGRGARRPRRCSRARTAATRWVQPLVGRHAAPLGDRPRSSADADRARAALQSRVAVVVARAPVRGAARRPSATRPSPVGGSCSSAARRPRSCRVRRARRRRAPARPRRGPAPAHVARRDGAGQRVC